MFIDSVDKIVTCYFAVLARRPFVYKGRVFKPKPVRVSPALLRGYTCPVGCGGCCPRFSLDYLPDEEHPSGVLPRAIAFDGRAVLVYSDLQVDHNEHHCRNLRKVDGRCGIYPVRPFSCDFELIRTLLASSTDRPNTLTQKLFGRGWAMLRVDDERGALCEMTPADHASVDDVVRKLQRFQQWADHFGVDTWVPDLINRLENYTSASCVKPIKNPQTFPGHIYYPEGFLEGTTMRQVEQVSLPLCD